MDLKVPNHIGIIPDGNRRCALRLMKRPWKGHEWGVRKFRTVLEWCKEYGIHNITFYALSLENLEKRPKNEVDFLFKLARKELKDIIGGDSFIHKNKVKMYFFGELKLLPKDIQDLIEEATKKTSNYNGFRLNIAIAYGGRQEIVNAARKLAEKVIERRIPIDKITEEVFRQGLQTNGSGDPDLIIRTGQERRLSNFLLFQSAYSELAFLDCYWPDLKKEDFVNVVKNYSNRERRFGK